MFKKARNNFYNMLELRKNKHREEVDKYPEQQKYLRGWLDRVDRIGIRGEYLAKKERLGSLYSENVNSNMDNAIKEYTDFNKIDDNDKLNNKIHYYMQKNQEALNKHNYTKQNKPTGFAINISNADRDLDINTDINNEDFRNKMYFSREDVGKMTTKEFSEMEDIINR